MGKYTQYADLGDGKPTLLFSPRGALLMAAIVAYEHGHPSAERIVDRTLALAAERGYSRSAEFRAEFRRRPADAAARQYHVDAVFEYIDSWEFVHRIMAPLITASQGDKPAPEDSGGRSGGTRSLH